MVREFFNYALEIAGLKRVKSSVLAIEGDAIAKKELSAKLTAYQNLLFNSLFVAIRLLATSAGLKNLFCSFQ